MNGRELAQIVDASEATISRIASGERRPSIELMGRIREALAWGLDEQWSSLAADSYASEFRTKMESRGVRAATGATRV